MVVEPGVSVLQQQLKQLFPGEDIQVGLSEEAIILSGQVSSNSVMLRSAEVAQATSSKLKVINMLQLPGGNESQQVMLQVRIAEVNQRALLELGASIFTSGNGFHNTWGRIGTQQFPGPEFDNLASTKVGDEVVAQSGELNFSDFLNLFFLSANSDLGMVIRALKGTGHFQSLAEPNLIAYNGQDGKFPGGRRVPRADRAGNHRRGLGRVQGIWRAAEFHADGSPVTSFA